MSGQADSGGTYEQRLPSAADRWAELNYVIADNPDGL